MWRFVSILLQVFDCASVLSIIVAIPHPLCYEFKISSLNNSCFGISKAIDRLIFSTCITCSLTLLDCKQPFKDLVRYPKSLHCYLAFNTHFSLIVYFLIVYLLFFDRTVLIWWLFLLLLNYILSLIGNSWPTFEWTNQKFFAFLCPIAITVSICSVLLIIGT